jgi:hypothetical protein
VRALDPGAMSSGLRAVTALFEAKLAAAGGERDRAPAGFAAAAFPLAVALLEHGEWLAPDEAAQPLLEEARAIFERLGASPWLERLERVEQSAARAG